MSTFVLSKCRLFNSLLTIGVAGRNLRSHFFKIRMEILGVDGPTESARPLVAISAKDEGGGPKGKSGR